LVVCAELRWAVAGPATKRRLRMLRPKAFVALVAVLAVAAVSPSVASA